MELVQGTHKASKFEAEDYISNMPDNVVTNILNRVPLHYAVRTGILSKDWRFKWTMLSELVFDEKFYNYLVERKCWRNFARIINKLLPHFEGAITKFDIFLVDENYDIKQWIFFLSKKGVKDLTIIKINGDLLKLPAHIYFCLELKHLKLENCFFYPRASFDGFPNLLSLELFEIVFEKEKLAQFFIKHPMLEILNIGATICMDKVKLVEIVKLTNLKRLTLFIHNLDDAEIASAGRIIELLGFLPKLQELELDFRRSEPFTEDDARITENDARIRSPCTFPCLNRLKLSKLYLGSGIVLSFAFEIIRSSPNLQALEITTDTSVYNLSSVFLSPEFFTEDVDTKRSPTAFPCLKAIKISLASGIMLSFGSKIITSSPSLQTLEIVIGDWDDDSPPTICSPESFTKDGVRKNIPATFPCLNTLKLSNMDLSSGNMLSFAFQMITSSPSLQTLEITSGDLSLNKDGARKRSPTTFPCLKSLKLSEIDLGSGVVQSFAFEIMKSSPNLETLEITAGEWDVKSRCAIVSSEVDCNETGLLQLRSVVFEDLEGSENDICWIKYVLASSPSLERIRIRFLYHLACDQKYTFARKLVKLHRASPVVDIDLY